jgi:radical SAM enzyme (TIGR01210 family)
MTLMTSESWTANDIGSAERAACEFVLHTQGIDHRDILTVLVFGSRARRSTEAANDVDLIFLIDERADLPPFSYRRLHSDAGKIDCNVIKTSFLNELCQSDVGWSYRLHHARPVQDFGKVPEQVVSGWIAKIDSFVESSAAGRYRLLRHVRDCRFLLRGIEHFDGIEHGIARYFMLEVLFVLPIIYLNSCRILPFQNGIPWNEALHAADSSSGGLSRQYRELVAQISELEFFRDLNRHGEFARELKDLRDECRTAISRHLGNVFRNGFGMNLRRAFESNNKLQREIARSTKGPPEPYEPLIGLIWSWLNLAREPQRSSKLLTAIRTKVRRQRDRESGLRYIHYEEESSRLKAIIPTGGCRVPACTFCMLPSLARTKLAIDETIAAIKAAARQGSVRQVTIYTDGSFFDNRELTQDERLQIATTARELGAEELLVESLPRFLDATAVEGVIKTLGAGCRLRLGVGLQSANALIRKYATHTPVTQIELRALLKWRQVAPFVLRIYMLANKPLLSPGEDRLDLHRSLQLLNEWLTDEDIVSVNPLLPTSATLMEKVRAAGFWRPMSAEEVQALQADLRSKNYIFRLEAGPAVVSTCSDFDVQSSSSGERAGPGQLALTDAALLPWSILGSLRSRSRWAIERGLYRG